MEWQRRGRSSVAGLLGSCEWQKSELFPGEGRHKTMSEERLFGLDRYSKLKRSSERIRARAIRVQLGSRTPGILHPRGKYRSLSLIRFHRTRVEIEDLQAEDFAGPHDL